MGRMWFSKRFTRLAGQAGFSLAEVMVASAVSAFIAMGTGKAILNAVSERKKMEYRSQDFALANAARAMFETRVSVDPTRCSQFFSIESYGGKANFTNRSKSLSEGATATSLGGAAVQITLPNGMQLLDGFVTGDASNGVRITDVRFANAEVFYSDNVNGSTYYNGHVFIKGEKLGQKNGKGYVTSYAPTLVASITLRVRDDNGAVESCAALPPFDKQQFCETIKDMNAYANPQDTSEQFCAPDVRTFAAACPTGQRFVGFSHDDFTRPMCVSPVTYSCAALRERVLQGVRQSVSGGTDGIEVAAAQCVDTEQSKHEKHCKATDCTPKPTTPDAPRRPPQAALPPVNTSGGPGVVGGADCPTAAAIEQYQRCLLYSVAATASDSERAIACGSVPARCYTPAAAPTPTNPVSLTDPLVAPPPPPVAPTTAQCDCGGIMVDHGTFCGSYYFASYGFFYTGLEASLVTRCDNGTLVLHSDVSPTNPTAAPAQIVVAEPETLDFNERVGNYRPLNKSGTNQYAIP